MESPQDDGEPPGSSPVAGEPGNRGDHRPPPTHPPGPPRRERLGSPSTGPRQELPARGPLSPGSPSCVPRVPGPPKAGVCSGLLSSLGAGRGGGSCPSRRVPSQETLAWCPPSVPPIPSAAVVPQPGLPGSLGDSTATRLAPGPPPCPGGGGGDRGGGPLPGAG